jgi:molybdopterin synthase catalytic subunit
MSWLTDHPIDTAALIARVMRPSDGAYGLFEGVVRNHHEGRAVESIDYDAYRPMAEKELERIVRGVEQELPGVAITLLHRLGFLRVGEASIAIVCASPHRAEAFAACRMVIDRIKETVPIWKKERGPDGEEWVGWCQHEKQEGMA